jgi:signal peptidase I
MGFRYPVASSPEPPQPEPVPAARRRNPALGCVIELVETLVLTFLIFVGVQTFLAQPYQVEQQSMEQTVEPGEYILVDKLTPRLDDYKRGDVIVFKPPPDFSEGNGQPFIKRIIGVGGDTVEIHDDGKVAVNGDELDEPYTFQHQPTLASTGVKRWVVPAGDYFVMGDHRMASSDSRAFGFIKRDEIIGRAWLRYWPFARFGILPSEASVFTAVPQGN